LRRYRRAPSGGIKLREPACRQRLTPPPPPGYPLLPRRLVRETHPPTRPRLGTVADHDAYRGPRLAIRPGGRPAPSSGTFLPPDNALNALPVHVRPTAGPSEGPSTITRAVSPSGAWPEVLRSAVHICRSAARAPGGSVSVIHFFAGPHRSASSACVSLSSGGVAPCRINAAPRRRGYGVRVGRHMDGGVDAGTSARRGPVRRG
jgi:hypothetical protein